MKYDLKEGVIFGAIFALGQLGFDFYEGHGHDVWGLLLSTTIASAVFVWLQPRAKKFWEKSP